MSRPKGYAAWSPRPDAVVLLDQIRTILDEYRDYLPMTARQIFYRMVGAHGYEKTERAYKRLADLLVRARRARLIPFTAIRDDGTTVLGSVGYYSNPEEFLDGLRQAWRGYDRVLMESQPAHVEVWCEAAGMAPQLTRVADDYGIHVYSTGGFSSVTVTYEIGLRVASYWRREKKATHFLHVGDFDPSGVSLYEAMVEDASRFAAAHGAPRLRARRVALTEDQVYEHQIPTAPPKSSDTRSASWVGETAQAEAMPPDLLAATLRAAIEDVVDLDLLQETKDEQEDERERLREKLESLAWDE